MERADSCPDIDSSGRRGHGRLARPGVKALHCMSLRAAGRGHHRLSLLAPEPRDLLLQLLDAITLRIMSPHLRSTLRVFTVMCRVLILHPPRSIRGHVHPLRRPPHHHCKSTMFIFRIPGRDDLPEAIGRPCGGTEPIIDRQLNDGRRGRSRCGSLQRGDRCR